MRSEKKGLHPRNQHRGLYPLKQLGETCPELTPFIGKNKFGEISIDFANPDAVKTLNRALLKHFYGISNWDIPPHYLCPPIPGRADYIHSIADLLGSCNGNVVPRGESIRVLDIGVGANCVYPLIGQKEYGWSFLGSEIDPVALASAERILAANPGLAGTIQLRRQAAPLKLFAGLLKPDETFDLSICNPPFHASLEEAQEGTRRKWKNLGREPRACNVDSKAAPVLNFGGQGLEICCPGGEAGFVRRMVEESFLVSKRIFWFSTLVSKEANLPYIYGALDHARPFRIRTMDLAHGQKKSRIVAWTFLNEREQNAWSSQRWR